MPRRAPPSRRRPRPTPSPPPPDREGSGEPAGGGIGPLIRQRRTELRLTLRRLAALADCSASYLSQVESGRRARPPQEDVLERIERSLSLPAGQLRAQAQWQRTPRDVRRQVERLTEQQRAARQLADLLAGRQPPRQSPHQPTPSGRGQRRPSLDSLYRSGELRRLIDRISPDPSQRKPRRAGGGGDVLELPLTREVPLINSVAAGYPTEFTDLGYPARVADEYIRTPDIADADAFAARVVGDSMEPDYREGDIVVFSPARIVKSGMDCFARLEPDHETTFKRVYFEPPPDGSGGAGDLIRLQPLNPAYPARVVRREDVAGLYAAVSVTRAVGQDFT